MNIYVDVMYLNFLLILHIMTAIRYVYHTVDIYCFWSVITWPHTRGHIVRLPSLYCRCTDDIVNYAFSGFVKNA